MEQNQLCYEDNENNNLGKMFRPSLSPARRQQLQKLSQEEDFYFAYNNYGHSEYPSASSPATCGQEHQVATSSPCNLYHHDHHHHRGQKPLQLQETQPLHQVQSKIQERPTEKSKSGRYNHHAVSFNRAISPIPQNEESSAMAIRIAPRVTFPSDSALYEQSSKEENPASVPSPAVDSKVWDETKPSPALSNGSSKSTLRQSNRRENMQQAYQLTRNSSYNSQGSSYTSNDRGSQASSKASPASQHSSNSPTRGRSRHKLSDTTKPRKQYRRPDSKMTRPAGMPVTDEQKVSVYTDNPSNAFRRDLSAIMQHSFKEYQAIQEEDEGEYFDHGKQSKIPAVVASKAYSPASVTENLGVPPAWVRERDADVAVSDSYRSENHREHRNRGRPAIAKHDEVAGESELVADGHSPYTPLLDTVVVLRGGERQSCSSHILAYASPVLARHLRSTGGNELRQYRLDIPNGDLKEWKMLQPFLQPHSVQKASVSTQNIPTILVWFHELKLDILLGECDSLLSTLNFPEYEEPSDQDWQDILLLTQICSVVALPQTRGMCLNTLKSYLYHSPDVLCRDKHLLTTIIRILHDYSHTRKHLWTAVSSYLPVDLLKEHTGSGDDAKSYPGNHLVENPLFLYLWREGIKRHMSVRQGRRQREIEKERLRRWQQRKKALQHVDEELQRKNSIVDDANNMASDREPNWMHPVSPAPVLGSVKPGEEMKVPDVSDYNVCEEAGFLNDDVSVHVVDESGPNQFLGNVTQQALDEFTQWWRSWSGGNTPCDQCGDGHHDEPPSAPRRTVWLQSILNNLMRPPLLGPSSSGRTRSDSTVLSKSSYPQPHQISQPNRVSSSGSRRPSPKREHWDVSENRISRSPWNPSRSRSRSRGRSCREACPRTFAC